MAETRWQQVEGADVEALIRAAGNYVRPSEDLRPRTLEAAAEARARRRRSWRLASAALAATVMLWATASRPVTQVSDSATALEAADVWQLGDEVRRQAARAAAGPTWAMVDLLAAVRTRQAQLLSQPQR